MVRAVRDADTSPSAAPEPVPEPGRHPINFKKSPERVREFLQKRGAGFRVLLDPDGTIFGLYDGVTLPFTVIIDRAGEVKGGGRRPP